MYKVDIQAVDIRKAATSYLPYGDYPVQRKCPEHQDDTESLSIYSDHIYCYGCSFSIHKRLDALAWLLHLDGWQDALAVAPRYYLTEAEKRNQRDSEKKEVVAPTSAMLTLYEDLFWEQEYDRLSWLKYERGLTNKTITQFKLGHTGASFVIPIFDERSNLLTFRFRTDDKYRMTWSEYDETTGELRKVKQSKYRGLAGINQVVLYPAWLVASDTHNWLAVVEGEFDAILLWQAGIPAVTITNGASSLPRIVDMLPERVTRLVIVGDMDEPGRKAANELALAAVEAGLEVDLIEWPLSDGKDVTEYAHNGHNIKELLR